MPTKTELAYCAGVIDSDGSISINRRTTRVRQGIRGAVAPEFLSLIAVNQVEPEAVNLFSELFGTLVYHYRPKAYRRPRGRQITNTRPQYRWKVSARRANHVIGLLLPYLRIKQQQGRIALKLQDNIDNTQLEGRKLSAKTVGERLALYDEMHRLNNGRRSFTAKLI